MLVKLVASTTDYAALFAIPYLRVLTDDERESLAARTIRREFPAGALIFGQDEPTSGLYVVEAGVVRLYCLSPEGREQVLRLVRAGGSFNEVAVFDRRPNPASAQAVEITTTLVVDAEAIRSLLWQNPAFAEATLAQFGQQLRHLVTLVEDLSFRRVAARVAKILLQADRPTDGVGAGLGRSASVTQSDLAALAGTGREVVARTLRELARVGAIQLVRGHAQVIDRARLERYLD